MALVLTTLCVTWATDAAAACVPAAAGKLRAAAATAMAPGHLPLAPEAALLRADARRVPVPTGDIVGLWRVVYTIKAPNDPELDGEVFDEAFQIFNAGGTEMMLSNGLSPGLVPELTCVDTRRGRLQAARGRLKPAATYQHR